MFNKIKYTYLNHKERIRLLSSQPILKSLLNSIQHLFILILLLDTLLIVPYFKENFDLLGYLSILSMFLLIPLYYFNVKILTYAIIWVSKHFEVRVKTLTDLDV